MWTRAAAVALGGAILTTSSAGCADEQPKSVEVRFAGEVVSFAPGEGAGFGAEKMPGIVLGPPQGGGATAGGTDVLTLGRGGEIVLRMAAPIVDGPGADFIVFENGFQIGTSTQRYEELGEVAVSEDAVNWTAFPCDPAAAIVDGCAGRTPVLSSSSNGISPTDPAAAGGDAYDLASVGVARAVYVRIRDVRWGGPPPTNGFDLDAIASIHHERR